MSAAGRMTGHCLCEAVGISIDSPKRHVELCHCDMCRRWGGTAFAAVTGEEAGEIAITGEESIAIFKSSDWAERAFCRNCGSNLWYRFLPTGSRSFSAGLFAEADEFDIDKEIFVDERPRWSPAQGDHPRLTGAEVIEEAKEAGFSFD